ncbi:MAG: glycosyltransferase family 39 protein [Candidatus Melainabacteria bacterium]|nr:MAG: glycosyltransferase family 39 protein [Candidatus Melainabacteria bacterium]
MKINYFIYSIIFVIALAVRLCFVFADGHLAIAAIGDSSEYLKDAHEFYKVLTNQAEFSSLALMMKQAGCVFPLFLIFSYFISGHIPDGNSVIGPLLGQCLISALSCVLIAMTAKRCWSAPIGFVSAALAIFYPGFIVNCARVLSENLAVFLVTVASYLTVSLIQETNDKNKLKWALGLGTTLALLQQTRSALVLFIVPVALVLLMQIRSKTFLKTAISAVFGFILVLAPVFFLQNLSIGSISFMPDRKQNYNLCVGLDPVGRGWITYPFMSFAALENKSAPQIIKEQMRRNPSEFWSLLLDKPSRLFKFHWNDFRTSIGPVAMSDQIFIHQLLLFLACIGVGFGFFVKSDDLTEGRKKVLSRCFLIGIVAVHSVYVLFSTLPRYGITAMPQILMFAAFGLYAVADLLKNKATRKDGLLVAGTGLALLILLRLNIIAVLRAVPGVTHFNTAFYLELTIKAIAYIFFTALLFHLARTSHNFSKRSGWSVTVIAILIMPFTVTHLAVHGRAHEWKTELVSSGNSIKQNILVPKNKIADLLSRDCFVIIDCQNWHALGQNAEVLVNGQKLNSPVFPLMPLVQNLSTDQEMESLFSSLLIGAGGTLHDLRQWYAIALPPAILANIANLSNSRSKPELELEIRNADNQNRSRKSRFFGSYVPKRNQVIIPGLHYYSWDKTFCGVERTDEFSDSRFDEKFLLAELSEGKTDLSRHTGFQSGSYNIRLLAAPKKEPAVELFKMVQTSIKQSSPKINQKIELLRTAQYEPHSIWVVTFKGNLVSEEKSSFAVPIKCSASINSLKKSTLQHFVPSSIEVDQGDNPVQFSFLTSPSALGLPVTSVSLELSEGGRAKSRQYFGVKNYHESYLPKLSWKDCSLTISEMHANPIADGFEIF